MSKKKILHGHGSILPIVQALLKKERINGTGYGR